MGGSILLLILVIVYISLFLQTGIRYHDYFLPKIQNSNSEITQYEGKIHGQYLTVNREEKKENITTTFHSSNFHLVYDVNFILLDKDCYQVTLTANGGDLLFEGMYEVGMPYLNDSNGELDFDFTVITSNNIQLSDIQPSKLQIIETALGFNEEQRGHGVVLIGVVILAIILAIDIKFPLVFFQMEHTWDVQNPEPTDYYYGKQKLGRVVLSIAIVVLLFMAVMN